MINFSKQYYLQASQENYEEHLRLNPGDDLDEMGQLLYRLNYLARKCELFCERLKEVQENKNNKVYVISTWCPDGELMYKLTEVGKERAKQILEVS